MPFNESELPEWKKNNPDPKPSQAQLDKGYKEGEKPAASTWNWFAHYVSKALLNLFKNAIHKEEKGKPNGVAVLDDKGKLAPGQENTVTIPDATLEKKGIVMLSNKTDGESESLATTEKALSTHVKVSATDLIAGHVRISDKVDGERRTVAASELAVKDAKEAAIKFTKDFGLGSSSKQLPGVDLNDVTVNGFYYCLNCTNTPVVANGYLNVQVYTTDYIAQTFIVYGYGRPGATYGRVKEGGVWQPWRRIVDESMKNAPNGFLGLDGNGKIPESLFPTVPIKIANGSYAGDGTGAKQIVLGFKPKYMSFGVYQSDSVGQTQLHYLWLNGSLYQMRGSGTFLYGSKLGAEIMPNELGFLVGTGTNHASQRYEYTAIG